MKEMVKCLKMEMEEQTEQLMEHLWEMVDSDYRTKEDYLLLDVLVSTLSVTRKNYFGAVEYLDLGEDRKKGSIWWS